MKQWQMAGDRKSFQDPLGRRYLGREEQPGIGSFAPGPHYTQAAEARSLQRTLPSPLRYFSKADRRFHYLQDFAGQLVRRPGVLIKFR